MDDVCYDLYPLNGMNGDEKSVKSRSGLDHRLCSIVCRCCCCVLLCALFFLQYIYLCLYMFL